jgi:acyl-CoA hydrolase
VALTCLLAGTACSGKKADPIPRGAVVLVLGDSITAGYGLGADKAWTATLAAETGWQVINAGVSGDTTAGGAARLPALLDEHQPQAVIVELGGNDMLRRRSSRETIANIEAMLADIRARGARPILMATPQPSVTGAVFSSLSDAPFYAEIADRQSVPLIDGVLAKVLSNPEYKLDQLHPNADGHRRVGEAAAKVLRAQGLAG